MTELQITSQGATLQGTGHLSGELQYFVRLSGCKLLSCYLRPVCDEVFSLSARAGHSYDVETILSRALAAVGEGGWLHITGGEPTDNPLLFPFIEMARERGLKVHLQTHGGNDVPVGATDWLTVSPKVPLDKLKVRDRLQGEMVLVFDGQPLDEMAELHKGTAFAHYFLQPKWVEGHPVGSITHPIKELAKLGSAWRGAIQAHKYWRCS